MITRYFKNNRPEFFTRLSNLIILQFLFITIAFGLLFLYPIEEKISSTNPLQLEEKFDSLSHKIIAFNNVDEINSCVDLLESEFSSTFEEFDYIGSNIFILDDEENVKTIFNNKSNQYYESDNFDMNFIKAELLNSESHLLQTIPSTKKLVYYYTFNISDSQKVVLASEFEHHYFVTSSEKVLYIFGLLFLGGILISLLMVYLINKRIREPLTHIMNGLEKTAQGDLYYMVETNKDIELNKLTESFNKMSKTLWYKDQKLKKYNKNLIEANCNLLNSREFLRKVLDNSTSSIITTSPEGNIQVFNETAGEHFLLSTENAFGSHISELFIGDFDPMQSDYKSHKEVEVVCKKSDNTIFHAFVRTAPIYDSELNLVSLLYVIHDISESKSIHNMMIQMDRYYTKGEMAGDIAHEINNFLAILSGNIELMPLILKKNDPEKITSKLELMKKQVDRIVRFTDGLLEANDGDESFVQVDMNQLILAVTGFLQPQNLFDYLNIETSLSDNIPLVHTKIGQIRQLFVNLVYNAGEELFKIEGESSLQIITELTGENDNQTVTITVKDNGPGISKENLDYLFHKRFTTKPHGNGISLVACKKIVESHSGSITYSFDNGAVFTVVLPVVQKNVNQNESIQTDSNSVYA